MAKLLPSIAFKTNDGSVHFGDNAYGEFYIVLKGPRGGERGDEKITREQALELAHFILEWAREEG